MNMSVFFFFLSKISLTGKKRSKCSHLHAIQICPIYSFSPATPFRRISKPGTDRLRYFLEHCIFTIEKYFILSLFWAFFSQIVCQRTHYVPVSVKIVIGSRMKNSFSSLQLPVSSFFDFQQKWIGVERKSFDFLFFSCSFNTILFLAFQFGCWAIQEKFLYCKVFEDNTVSLSWCRMGF